MSEPLRKVSAKKYTDTAKIRWREKGKTDGPIYHGQVEVVPCASCGRGQERTIPLPSRQPAVTIKNGGREE
jgi:hypothetical protein